jgi:hypothetical protein
MPLTFSHIFLDLSHLKQKFKVSYLSKHSDVSIILQRVVNICTAFNSQETWVIKMLWLVHFIKQMFWDVCFYIFIIEMLWIVNFFITVYNVYFESLIFKVQILLTRPFYNKHNLSCPFFIIPNIFRCPFLLLKCISMSIVAIKNKLSCPFLSHGQMQMLVGVLR